MHRDPSLTEVKSNAQLMARRRAALPAGLGQTYEVFAERAENAELWDVEGKRYIDFAGGIAVLNTGHRHPKIVEAIRIHQEQLLVECFHPKMHSSKLHLEILLTFLILLLL